jgi:hypothetical protein
MQVAAKRVYLHREHRKASEKNVCFTHSARARGQNGKEEEMEACDYHIFKNRINELRKEEGMLEKRLIVVFLT